MRKSLRSLTIPEIERAIHYLWRRVTPPTFRLWTKTRRDRSSVWHEAGVYPDNAPWLVDQDGDARWGSSHVRHRPNRDQDTEKLMCARNALLDVLKFFELPTSVVYVPSEEDLKENDPSTAATQNKKSMSKVRIDELTEEQAYFWVQGPLSKKMRTNCSMVLERKEPDHLWQAIIRNGPGVLASGCGSDKTPHGKVDAMRQAIQRVADYAGLLLGMIDLSEESEGEER